MVKKAVILAGGLGTRLSEETHLKPKPMVDIGDKPILWHLMKVFSHHGINEFIICTGYKGYVIKEFFANYSMHTSNVTFNLKTNTAETHNAEADPWRVLLVDTGLNSMTGGRLKLAQQYIGNEDFCMTYGDGLANVDIKELITFHKKQGRLATVTAVRPPARFGSLQITDNKVTSFKEKPVGDGMWINGGFFVLSPKVLQYIESPSTPWESNPLQNLASEGQLSAYLHHGFWHPMDTLRDKNLLEELWLNDKAPWKIWD